MMKVRRHKWLVLALCIGLSVRVACSFLPGSGDINNHLVWSQDYMSHGAAGFYEREFRKRVGVIEPNYPPLSIWTFVAVREFYSTIEPVAWYLNVHIPAFPSSLVAAVRSPVLLPALIRWPAIAADAVIAVLVYMFVTRIRNGDRRLPLSAAIAILANPVFIYNSAIWGQIDAIPVCFLLAALYTILFTRRYWWTVVWLICAVLTKQTAVVLLPLFGYQFLQKVGMRQSLAYAAGGIATLCLAMIPFYNSGNVALFLINTYVFNILTAAGLPFISNHAFNVWGLITGFSQVHANQKWAGISYGTWAYLLSLAIYAGIMYIYRGRKNAPIQAIAVAGLLTYSMFLLLPRMHERHLLIALPFLLIWSFAAKRRWIYWSISAFHGANIYHGRWYPPLPLLQHILSDIRTLFFITGFAILLFIILVVHYIRNTVIYIDDK